MKKSNILVFKKMSGGSYFGDREIFENKRRHSSAVAKTECDAFCLSKHVLNKVIKVEFPLIYNILLANSIERQKHESLMK